MELCYPCCNGRFSYKENNGKDDHVCNNRRQNVDQNALNGSKNVVAKLKFLIFVYSWKKN